MLSPNRDLAAAKMFLRLALCGASSTRVINVDGHPAYPTPIAELTPSGELGQRCRCRRLPYMNNIIEPDHRFIKSIHQEAHYLQPRVPIGRKRVENHRGL
jgi:transposase-like protein